MSTEAQQEASRLNGAKSHGPVTPEGKAISSQNSLKFGAYSKLPLLPGEDPQKYEAHKERTFQFWDLARGYHELELVQSVCDYTWRIKRLEHFHAQHEAADPF